MLAGKSRYRLSLFVLTVGFLGLAIGVYTAFRTPASTYEISIYRSTPTSFWTGCVISLGAGLSVAVMQRGNRFSPVLLLLSGSSVLAIAALPAIRGYYFYGLGDGLTHLGWAREIVAGSNPLDLLYPASHLVASAISTLGYELHYAMLLTIILFTVLFFLFVPLTIRVLISDQRATLIGSFAALLLLPIYQLGTSFMFVPFTFGLFFTPFVLYLFCKYLFESGTSEGLLPRGRMTWLLTLAGVTLLLLHSQVMLDLLILFSTVIVIQIAVRRWWTDNPIASHPSIAGEVVFLGVLFVLWNVNHERMFAAANGIILELTQGSEVGSIVQQRGGSLQDVGGSLFEMFLKLFLVNAVFSVIAAGLVFAVFLGRSERLSDRERAFSTYVGIGGIVLLPFFVLHFVGSMSSFFFRHIGFGMVLVTIVGAIGIYHLSQFSVRTNGPVIATATAIGLVLSLAILFPSPYIYLPNHHVTEEHMTGYEQMFEYRSPDSQFAGIRGGTERTSSAYPGVPEIRSRNINSSMINAGLNSQFDQTTYVIVSETDRQRELVAYDEIRYSPATFRNLTDQPRASRISTNGQVDVFYFGSNSSAGRG